MRKIATVFYSGNASTVGNANRISRYQLLARHYDLTILTNQPHFMRNQVKARVVGIPNIRLPFFSQFIFWFLAGIALVFIRYDLLFLVFYDAPVAFFNFRKPFLCHIHQSHDVTELGNGKRGNLRTALSSHLILKATRKADHCFAVSEKLVELYVNKGVDRNRISYLPHGVDLEKFRKNGHSGSLPVPKDKFLLMYTGWVSEKRGLRFMLDGIKETAKVIPNAHLVVVGADEDQLDEVEILLEEMSLREQVTVVGRIPYEEIPAYINCSHVGLSFRVPNTFYSFYSPPQKILEYFAMGKPVVANDLLTHRHFVVDGYNGYLIGELDANLFRDAIVKLYEDQEHYLRMSGNAINFALQHDMKKVEEILISKVQSLLGEKEGNEEGR